MNDSILSLKKSVIYQILIDRFAGYDPSRDWKKNQFIGGNIKGIINVLPYLKNLGVDYLWISPFYKTSAYHGYHITDFYEVDSHFGTKNDLKRLIDIVHQNNMKIIADFVPNHVSRLHPFFLDAQNNEDSAYRNWFYFKNWPNDYLCFLSVRDLPKLNLKNKKTKEYILDVAKYWLSFGLDGYRLDHVIGLSNKFWNEFTVTLKQNFPNCLLIGEAWMKGISWKQLNTIQIPWKRLKWLQKNASDQVLSNYVSILDGVLDFSAQHLFQHYLCQKHSSIHELKQALNKHYSSFPQQYLLPTFLDNHDMDRFLFKCNEKMSILKKAASVLFGIAQPVIIYYGTEQGLSQYESVWDHSTHGDLLARKAMPWNEKEQNFELYNFYRNLIRCRKMDK